MSIYWRKKPTTVRAIQFIPGNVAQLEAAFGGNTKTPLVVVRDVVANAPYEVRIKTLEGVMSAGIGSYIIEGIDGELYPCKEHIFLHTYEYAG